MGTDGEGRGIDNGRTLGPTTGTTRNSTVPPVNNSSPRDGARPPETNRERYEAFRKRCPMENVVQSRAQLTALHCPKFSLSRREGAIQALVSPRDTSVPLLEC